MNRKTIFDVRGANGWIISLSVVANLLWSFFTFIIAFYALDVSGKSIEAVQVGLLIGEFIGPLLIGWFCGWMAFDDRGAMYGVMGALGSVFMIMLTLLASGGITIMLSIAALAGGFNGGAITHYRDSRK